MSWAIRLTLIAILIGTPVRAFAADATNAQGMDFFEKKIRPALVANCYQCHSASAKELKGELRLDTKEGLRKGGESGAIIVAGKPDDSLLIQSLRHENGLEMPPQKKLPDEVIADFVKWVEMGAPDPRAANATTVGGKYNKIDARKHWSFQPVNRRGHATIKNAAWPRTEIDKYILAGLEAKQLKPVADADKETLIRRVTFDLIGLPPTPQEIDAFVNDQSSTALEKVIDRLLASLQFGERWGRHWLDVARYGESTGKERNVPFPNAWRYRDYVYDAFNADKPYDQFIREQIAGDLLPAKNDAEKNEHLIATGFLTLGPKSLNQRNREQYLMDQADEQIDVATRAVMALSVACARCHDHKFDPIPQTDYYALAGIFKSTDVFAGVKAGNNKTGYSGEHLSLIDSGAKQPASTEDRRELARLRDELEKAEKELAAAKANARKPAAEPKPVAAAGKNAKQKAKQKAKKEQLAKQKANPLARFERAVANLKQQIRDLEAKISPPGEPVMAVRESDRVANCRVNIRGEVNDLGPEVPRGFVSVLTTAQSPKVNLQQSGRLQLAVWLTQKQNPLTARVMVNRLWYHLFGRGLVETVDNFGALSEPPTHPELLDYLAIRFMDNGWSVKKTIKEIMLSRTYQLSSDHDDANYAADPDNKLQWRMSRRRLDAEAIRDAILAISGQLDLKRPPGSLTQEISGGEIGRQARTEALKKPVTFRSAYLPLVRGLVPEFLSIFDVADPELVVGQRDVTTVATQALYMMNSPLVREQSQHAARRILADQAATDDARIDLAFRLAFGRMPQEAERQSAHAFLRDFEQSVESSKPLDEKRRAAWAGLCHSLFASAEFRYVY